MVPTPVGEVVRLAVTEKPPRSGCWTPIAFVLGSSWTVVSVSGVGGAPTVVVKEGPNGPESAKPEGVSVTVAFWELNPGALAV